MSPLRLGLLALILFVAACGNKTIPLPEIHADDPVLQLNPDRWHADVNDLMIPPGNGEPHPLPAPVPSLARSASPPASRSSIGSEKVPVL